MRKIDYRHYICITLTLGFIACSVFLFSNSFYRILDSFKDLGLSLVYYFCKLLRLPYDIKPSVTGLGHATDIAFLPKDFETFKLKLSEYWQLLKSKNNFNAYFSSVGKFVSDFSVFIIFILPLFLILVILVRRNLRTPNNDYNIDSRPLKAFKKITLKTYIPVKNWAVGFVSFIRKYRFYFVLWCCIWAWNFNLFTIVIEVFAYYFYFVTSLDLLNLYLQVYKLFSDLSVMIDFLPAPLWAVIGLIVFDYFRKRIAMMRLHGFEMRNRSFIQSMPISVMVVGTMGKKKTTMLTDMALSQEAIFRDKALELLRQQDMKFPNFPWINLEKEIEKAMQQHRLYSLVTCKQFVDPWEKWFNAVNSDKAIYKSWHRHLKKHPGEHLFPDLIFGYDYTRYGMDYDNNLSVVNVWEVVRTYAQLYFLYITKSSLLMSNYSVRQDGQLADAGNFPLWNNDFLGTDSRELSASSSYSHIIDFDCLRLGRRVLPDNPRSGAFEFGGVVITEVGKERGNMLDHKELKKNTDETNQKNDLFNSWLKTCRHSSTVANYPFVKVLMDDQRPESLGADARELCDIINIEDAGEQQLAMPFTFLGDMVYDFILSRFDRLYSEYRFLRGDNTLLMYLFKGLASRLQAYHERIVNKYGFSVLSLETESGTFKGGVRQHKYFLSNKKIYSSRFATDCFSDYFAARSLDAAIGLDDLDCYSDVKASMTEFRIQNSYFMSDLENIKDKAYDKPDSPSDAAAAAIEDEHKFWKEYKKRFDNLANRRLYPGVYEGSHKHAGGADPPATSAPKSR